MEYILQIIGLPFQLIYAVTGAMFGLLPLLLIPSAFLLFDGDAEKVMETVNPSMAIHPPEDSTAVKSIHLQEYYLKAKQLFPNKEITRIGTHHLGSNDGMISINVDDEIAINGGGFVMYALKDGRELMRLQPNEVEYTNSVLNAMTKMHYGAFGGFFMRIIYFFLGLITCFMLIKGILLWYEARNNRKYTDKQQRFHYRITKLFLSICLAMLPATALIFLANKLVPYETPSRVLVVNSIFFISWLVFTTVGLFQKKFRKISLNYLLMFGLLGLLVPLANGYVTGDWFWKTISEGNWYVAGVDLSWLVIGIISLVLFIKTPQKAKPQTENRISTTTTSTKKGIKKNL